MNGGASVSKLIGRTRAGYAERIKGKHKPHGNSGRGKRVFWNEVEYPSIKSAALANGFPEGFMGRMIRMGYSCAEDVKRLEKAKSRLSLS